MRKSMDTAVGDVARNAARRSAGYAQAGRKPRLRKDLGERFIQIRVPSEVHANLVADSERECRTLGAQVEYLLRERYGLLAPMPESACA